MRPFIFFLTFLLLVSCSNDDDDGIEMENTDEMTYQFYQNTQVDLNANGFAQIRSGESLVFEYQFTAADNPNIADDEFSEPIVFEIPENLDSFSFIDEELMTIRAYYDKFCFCVIEGSIPLVKGEISGSKINESSWDVTINVEFEDFETVNKTLSENFILSEFQ